MGRGWFNPPTYGVKGVKLAALHSLGASKAQSLCRPAPLPVAVSTQSPQQLQLQCKWGCSGTKMPVNALSDHLDHEPHATNCYFHSPQPHALAAWPYHRLLQPVTAAAKRAASSAGAMSGPLSETSAAHRLQLAQHRPTMQVSTLSMSPAGDHERPVKMAVMHCFPSYPAIIPWLSPAALAAACTCTSWGACP